MHYGKEAFISQENLKKRIATWVKWKKKIKEKEFKKQGNKYFHINLMIYQAQNIKKSPN